MKLFPHIKTTVLFVLLLTSALFAQTESSTFPTLKGPYLGQTPPGDVPVKFAPGIITTNDFEFAITFSPDGKECYFTRRGKVMNLSENTIIVTKMVDGVWTKPAIAPFSGKVFDFEPHISTDGSKLFYGSNRQKPEGIETQGIIWYVDLTDGKMEPKYLDAAANDGFTMFPWTTNNGTLYHTGRGIFRSEFRNGKYEKPEKLSNSINSLPQAAHSYVAPDESYLIFDAQPDGREAGPDIFISYRDNNGEWTKAINMGDKINTSKEMCASVSPDGKYLFFAREGDIYWVDAKIINDLKPAGIK